MKQRLYRFAYPSFDCEQCVGQEWWQSCYCSYHGASAPCSGPTRLQSIARWLLGVWK